MNRGLYERGRLGDRLGGGVGEPVGGRDDEGLEGVPRVEDQGAGMGGLGHRRGRHRSVGHGRPAVGLATPKGLLRRLVDWGDHFELDRQIPPDRAGHGVLDETEESGLDPVPDQGIGHSQHNLMVFDGQR